MLRRIGIALLCVSALLVAADAAIAIDAWLRGSAPPRLSSPPLGVATDRPVPSVPLVDAQGHTRTLATLRGRYVVLAPFMTLCHEVCPMTTAALEALRRAADRDGIGNRLTVLEVTVDPWRDSPARLRAYAHLAGVAGVDLMTGTQTAIARLWRFLGVYYHRVPQTRPPDRDWLTGKPETFDVEHGDALFVIDPRGHLRIEDDGMPAVGHALPAALGRLLNGAGRANLAHPQAPWTADRALADVRYLAGLAAPDVHPPTARAMRAELAGSPSPLAALHAQAGRILGGGFRARLAALRGYPVVVNEWASWCPPCRRELPLFAVASARYARSVAFLGLDVNDPGAGAAAFLGKHPVSYPSFRDGDGATAQALASAAGLPTTVFLDRSGRVTYTHIGAYESESALADDIARHAER
jgi:cytochrome c biogenesis protein CcmG/thiol:disulfide interchange protein DsbE